MTRKKSAKSKVSFERRWHKPSKSLKPKAKPKSKKYITYEELYALIGNQLGAKLDKQFHFHGADDEYYCTPIDDARTIIRNSALERKVWVAERFDCDDFAHVLKSHFAEAAYKDGKRRAAHCFGVVWGNLPGPHAINWMVNSDMKLRFIEPQDDKIYMPRATDKDIYFMLV